MSYSLSPFAPDKLVSRDGFGSPVPRQSAHLHAQAESGAYLQDSSRVRRRRPFIIDRYTLPGMYYECSSTYMYVQYYVPWYYDISSTVVVVILCQFEQ